MDEIKQLVKEFLEDYRTAPLYGGYSRTMKRKIEGRQQIKLAFIDQLIMIQTLTDDEAVEKYIDHTLKKFEKM